MVDTGIDDLTSAFSLSRNSIKAIAIGGVIGATVVAGPVVALGVAGKIAIGAGAYILSGVGGVTGGYIGNKVHHN